MKLRFVFLMGIIMIIFSISGRAAMRIVRHTTVNTSVVDAISPTGCARTDKGDILISFQDRGDVSPGCKSYIVRSKDEGRTWSRPEKIFASSDPKEGIAINLSNFPDGAVFLSVTRIMHVNSSRQGVFNTRTSTIELFRSEDGKTFSPLQKLSFPEGSLFVDMGAPVELPGGDLILSAYGYPKRARIPGAVYGSGFFRSRDGGRTWGKFELAFRDNPLAGERPYAFNESAFYVKEDGTVVALARIDSRKQCNLWRVESKDNGKTWSIPVETNLPCIYPVILKKKNGGFIMAAGNRQARPIPRSLHLYYSADGNQFTNLGMVYYSRTNGKPANTATGGAQCLLQGQKTDQIMVAFYAHDPALPGHHQTYIDCNFIEVIQ